MNKLTKLGLNLFGLYISLFNQEILKAQIVPDRTLPNNSQISIEGNTLTIQGGTIRNSNLFHSFQDFSIPTGWEALFNNASAIQNIFSRVTGDSISNIDGVLRANGTANVFFLNPNGIIFGPNARLDIGGSFLATTADSILFADGTEFSAIAPRSSLLTVTVPTGLGFLGSNHEEAIRVAGTGYELILPEPAISPRDVTARTLSPFLKAPTSPRGLEVKPGKTLALIGGDVLLEGGVLSAPDGNIELGSVRSGQVNLARNGEALALTYNSVFNFGDVNLSRRSLVEVSGQPQAIDIWANNLSLTEGSLIVLQNQSQIPTGNLTVNVLNFFSIFGTSGAQTQEIRSSLISESLGLGNGGNIQISTRQLAIEEGGGIRSAALNFGRGGNINLIANDVLLRETTPFGSFSGIATITAGFGQGGQVDIATRTLTIADGAGLGSSTYGAFNAGSITVNASEKVEITGISRIPIRNTTVLGSAPTLNANITNLTFGSGKGGNLVLSTPSLFLNQEGAITSFTVGSGKAGDIAITADLIEIVGTSSSLYNSNISSVTLGKGDAGNLSLDTTNLIIRDGGGITTSTYAMGNSGELVVNVSELIELSGVDSRFGRASFIESSAPELSETLQQLFRLSPFPTGEPKSIVINAGRLRFSDGASISVRNDGTGNAGTIQISSPSISLNHAEITANTRSGEGGNLEINSSDLRLNNASNITATAGGTGNGGNISINTDTLVGLENSDITANAFAGRGGNIFITTQALFLSPDSDITASSELGIDGTVEIEVLQPLQPEQAVPVDTVSIEQLLSQSCLNRTEIRGTFNYVGNEGIPLTPESGFDRSGAAIKIPKPNTETQGDSLPETLERTETFGDRDRDDTVVANRKRPWKIGDPVVEPNQENKTPDGKIMLVTAISSSPVSVDKLICEPLTQPVSNGAGRNGTIKK